MPFRFDSHRLAKATRTPQGYVRVDARLTRTGVLSYRQPDGTVRRELRHPDDVFAPEAMAAADTHVPVTVGHPGLLTAVNTRQHRVGGLARPARRDGKYKSAELVIDDADTIARVDAGELGELSAGYTVDLEETPGVYEGERYDARQRSIVLNHVALLPPGGGRAGRDVGLRLDAGDAVLEDSDMKRKIRLDGVEVEVDANVADALEAAQAKLAESEKARGLADAKAVDLQGRLDSALDPKALDARVAQRVQLESAAQRVLGTEYSAAGKTARQVHEDVVKSVRQDADFTGKSDDYVTGQFEAVCAAPASARQDQVAAELLKVKTGTGAASRQDKSDGLLDPQAEYDAAIARRSGARKDK